MLDMGYIVMGILRFFIRENNFKEKDVTYPEYLDFITSLLKRDFGLNLSAQEYKELADYIFDKIKNEGRPFTFPYYDPIEKKKCISLSRYWKVPSVTIRYGIPSVPMQLNSIWIRKKLKKKAESVCNSCS